VRLAIPAALRDERGFTLVEIVVVVIVLAILSAVAVSAYAGYRTRAHDAAAQENVYQIIPSIHAYFVDYDSYTGMTIPGLKSSYDSMIDPALYSLGSVAPTDSTYCIHSSSEGRTWRRNGPTAALEPQPCP
jgi:prepilin-type N-terminal cleavage/methylation domain-containing protein